jgi:hypothetical protein
LSDPGAAEKLETYLDDARRDAERVKELLASPATLDAYDWGLVASLLVSADTALAAARTLDPNATLQVFDDAVEELRDASSNFTKPAFIAATKPPRRQRPALFTPR